MNECPNNLSKEFYDGIDSYPICKYCPHVTSTCPYLRKPTSGISYWDHIYSEMSEEELREELKDAERSLFM